LGFPGSIKTTAARCLIVCHQRSVMLSAPLGVAKEVGVCAARFGNPLHYPTIGHIGHGWFLPVVIGACHRRE
jgi:hypothetical protein